MDALFKITTYGISGDKETTSHFSIKFEDGQEPSAIISNWKLPFYVAANPLTDATGTTTTAQVPLIPSGPKATHEDYYSVAVLFKLDITMQTGIPCPNLSLAQSRELLLHAATQPDTLPPEDQLDFKRNMILDAYAVTTTPDNYYTHPTDQEQRPQKIADIPAHNALVWAALSSPVAKDTMVDIFSTTPVITVNLPDFLPGMLSVNISLYQRPASRDAHDMDDGRYADFTPNLLEVSLDKIFLCSITNTTPAKIIGPPIIFSPSSDVIADLLTKMPQAIGIATLEGFDPINGYYNRLVKRDGKLTQANTLVVDFRTPAAVASILKATVRVSSIKPKKDGNRLCTNIITDKTRNQGIWVCPATYVMPKVQRVTNWTRELSLTLTRDSYGDYEAKKLKALLEEKVHHYIPISNPIPLSLYFNSSITAPPFIYRTKNILSKILNGTIITQDPPPPPSHKPTDIPIVQAQTHILCSLLNHSISKIPTCNANKRLITPAPAHFKHLLIKFLSPHNPLSYLLTFLASLFNVSLTITVLLPHLLLLSTTIAPLTLFLRLPLLIFTFNNYHTATKITLTSRKLIYSLNKLARNHPTYFSTSFINNAISMRPTATFKSKHNCLTHALHYIMYLTLSLTHSSNCVTFEWFATSTPLVLLQLLLLMEGIEPNPGPHHLFS